MKIFRGVLLFIFSTIFFSCDAPRLNPFDPSGQEYKFAQIDGYVLTGEQPNQAIGKVTVTWKNQNITAQTDMLGYYKLSDIPRADGIIYFEKFGYKRDSIFVEWKNQNYKRVDNVLLLSLLGDLDGRVITSDVQPQVIEKVNVRLKGLATIFPTNSEGKYKITQVPVENGTLYFEKDGFKFDSLLFQWKDSKTKTLEDKKLIYSHGELSGTVTSFDARTAVSNVFVRIKGTSFVTQTDNLGKYKFSNTPIQNGLLYFEKEGFLKDSSSYNWTIGKTMVVDKAIKYSAGSISGYVFNERYRTTPISKTKVVWKNQNIFVESDAAGFFKLNGLATADGYLKFEHADYTLDSIYIRWDFRKDLTNQNGYLNAKPRLNELEIYSTVVNKYRDIQNTRMKIEAKIFDTENDIDSVFVQNKQLNLFAPIQFNQETRNYEREFDVSVLNVIYIDEVIGKPFEIVVKDLNKKTFVLGSSTLKRVIRQLPIIYSPLDGIEVSDKPTFEWQRFLPGFNFKYYIEIYTDEIPATLIWRSAQFSKNDIFYSMQTNIPAGSYYWVLCCVDDFFNKTVSYPGSFTVK